MNTNYFINIYDELSNGEWEHRETVQTRDVAWLEVKDGRVHHMSHGKSISEASMTREEAVEKHRGRYYQIAKSEPITDYVIGTFDICRFLVEERNYKYRYVIRVQLVNTRNPYYFVQKDEVENWRYCRTICHGANMQELRAGMDEYFKGGKYDFKNDQEREKFESLF